VSAGQSGEGAFASPKLERGFHQACADLAPARRILVYPGTETWPLAEDIAVMPLQAAGEALLAPA